MTTGLLVWINIALTVIVLDALRRTFGLVQRLVLMVEQHDADLRRVKARLMIL